MKRFIGSFAWLVRVAIGLLLIYSGTVKIARPYEFLNSVFQYELLGPRSATLVAGALPFVELTLGVALLCGLFTLGASFIACVLFLIFTVGQTTALARGLDADCGCFGAGEKVGWPSLLRTAALLAGAGLCLARAVKQATTVRADGVVDESLTAASPPGGWTWSAAR